MMTDHEIIKAFEQCTLKAEHPGFVLCGQIVDLINNQNAEIERLQEEVGKEFTCFVGDPHKVEHCPYLEEIEGLKHDVEVLYRVKEQLKDMYKTARAEAIKEFVNRLREKAIWAISKGWEQKVVYLEDIAHIEKEMVGDV